MALLMARMDVVRQQSISFSSKQDADTGVAATPSPDGSRLIFLSPPPPHSQTGGINILPPPFGVLPLAKGESLWGAYGGLTTCPPELSSPKLPLLGRGGARRAGEYVIPDTTYSLPLLSEGTPPC